MTTTLLLTSLEAVRALASSDRTIGNGPAATTVVSRDLDSSRYAVARPGEPESSRPTERAGRLRSRQALALGQ
jgi:hypothetical protein